MIDTVINTKDAKKADIVILSAPYEGGVSFMGGTAKAPQKILKILNENLELFDTDLLCEPAKKIKTAHREISGLKKLIPEKAIKKISSEYEKLFSDKKFVIMLGGEHTVALGALDAILKKENPEDITIFQIDAHQDLREDNSDYSDHITKYAHSCTMRRAHDIGFPIVQVGIRTFSKYEYNFWQKNKKTIKVFPWTKDNKIPKIGDIVKSIKTKKVYLSLDVDGIDPGFMPGTGTPVQGGLDWNYTLNLIEKLFREKNVIGADIVEVSTISGSVLTEFGAALLCYKIMTNKFRKKLK
ncbi:MAG: Arginase [Candidatus Nomurabacteria bacterium GW2011_GWA2_41_25]|uniref:Agmatinase n=2 Tax=Candidatus Nomuraibacteriota TaxID=1752729 RepID=A0A1F6YAM2_9BACT|nr:MAG: Arginase [Candidatus Nomurabacteria bacterium GW2011_GWA2_41_25]OGI66818.1 MAG: agmatinase [Candidatus Nomurabacteria bacterium RIFCSPHIGHO2_01_FULL_41_91]OGI80227.1 MAG: agmatinase [Candidatus Nomurabacteria bacterium RIFCSPHIGHO2_02_FULL_41_52]OGI84723.1 MAG: agmatinase [Candidatus Nomurabacteria bacterium RIFCSPHIGHO2_12_FULL_42_19]OGI93562.1 MAG: agmatinase [Candidatus Nomurabacteria bacterium RIFCSPLOWO2_01_FULL_41_52]OGI97734.1 MAG: agmatinase [Candidatus Nomurabacteria bacterium